MSDRASPVPRLWIEVEQGEGELVGFVGGAVYAYSSRCPGKSRSNEDAAALIPFAPDVGLLVVSDGLGGQPGADQASSIAVRTLAALTAEDPGTGDALRAGLLRAVEVANRTVTDLGVGAGTTLAMALVEGADVRPYHVGDSTILVTDARGRVRLATVPHSPIGYALEAGLLTEEEALCHPDRHIISNMVGSAEMKIEIGSPLALARGDTLLVASDGVTDNLLRAELVEIIRGGTLERAGESLVAICRDRMASDDDDRPSKPDDLTFLLFRRG